ncbi:MAG TPA: hypothetical protein VH309_04890 [Elusimicrobiota bacterium]|jgi:hypothetical protein|nr:hypothetical protein [Elusimicrobiota bacterium]
MRLRLFSLLVLACAVSGCAALNAGFADDDAPPEAAAPAPPLTPEQAYDDGILLQERGEYDAARREWDRCLAISSPDSPARVDCMVALEKTAAPAEASEP